MEVIKTLQDTINQRIADDNEGLIYTRGTAEIKNAVEIWFGLSVPEEPRRTEPYWNLVTDGEAINHIHLVKRKNIKYIPSVIMGDNIESDDGVLVGTLCKYAT